MVQFKDYYAVLGVARDASADAIKKAFRKKAKQFHPDVNKTPEAASRFREVNEAYEVLSDSTKRQRYDQLGANWRDGESFQPPPGWGGRSAGGSINIEDLFGGAGASRGGSGGSGFSDFFEMLFSDLGLHGMGRGAASGSQRARGPQRGADLTAEVQFSLLDLLQPGQKKMTLALPTPSGAMESRTVTVNIPKGVRPGQKLRLPGMGAAANAGSTAGDLYLSLQLKPDPAFRIERDDLVTEVDVPAPVAVLGGVVRPTTPEGPVALRVAAGTQGGTTLRVRGRGLWRRDGDRGDLLVRVRLTIPAKPTAREKELYEQLLALEEQGGAS